MALQAIQAVAGLLDFPSSKLVLALAAAQTNLFFWKNRLHSLQSVDAPLVHVPADNMSMIQSYHPSRARCIDVCCTDCSDFHKKAEKLLKSC